MRRSFFFASICLLFLLTVPAHRALERLRSPAEISAAGAQRIVSLAPSVTETLYALGLGPNVVGVTQFCAIPPEAATKPRVAGFGEINLEAIVRTLPDLVALPGDQTAARAQVESLGLPVLAIDTRSLGDLLASIETLGQATGHAREAGELIQNFREGLKAARERAEGKKQPRVLFSVMHSYQGLGYIAEINAIGRDGFYNELIETAGGINAYRGNLPFPRLSRESIIFLNPDVIIDVIPNAVDLESVRRDWESLTSVSAVRDKRLFLFAGGADTVPGPRSMQTLAKLSRAFHPDRADETQGGHQ
jgi:iron complex transport system substrate-binding protein